MSETAQKIETWDSPEGEAHMAEGHEPAWRAMVNDMSEDDLSGKNILDFGCNRGGFLKLLHRMKPYQSALGVDIAESPLPMPILTKKTSLPLMTTAACCKIRR